MADANNTQTPPTPGQDKLEAIRALFGEQVAMSLAQQVQSRPQGRPTAPDPSKLQWQQNQLIARLRAAQKDATPQQPSATGSTQLSGTIAKTILNTPVADLSAEHPAIIAYALKSHDQGKRVAALKSMPGQTARAVMQRLRGKG